MNLKLECQIYGILLLHLVVMTIVCLGLGSLAWMFMTFIFPIVGFWPLVLLLVLWMGRMIFGDSIIKEWELNTPKTEKAKPSPHDIDFPISATFSNQK